MSEFTEKEYREYAIENFSDDYETHIEADAPVTLRDAGFKTPDGVYSEERSGAWVEAQIFIYDDDIYLIKDTSNE